MGFIGGIIGFVVALIAGLLGGILLFPVFPWATLTLMIIGAVCTVGIVLSIATAPLMGAIIAGGIGLSRLAALILLAVIIVVTAMALGPISATFIALLAANALLIVGVGLGVFALIAATLVQLFVGGLAYLLAAFAYTTSGQSTFEAEARGGCAGVNAALNLLLGFGVVAPFLVVTFSPLLGGILSVLVVVAIVVAAIIPFTRSPTTGIVPGWARSAMGWLLVLLPTGWLLQLLGLVMYLVTLFLHATIGIFVPMFTVTAMRLRGDTGTIVMTGGAAGNLNPAPQYNIGTFVFVRTITPALIPIYDDTLFFPAIASVQNHEIGHQLNLGAFGSAFNLAGFVDEWLGPIIAGPAYAIYGEDLASTNDPTVGPFFPTPLNMWVV